MVLTEVEVISLARHTRRPNEVGEMTNPTIEIEGTMLEPTSGEVGREVPMYVQARLFLRRVTLNRTLHRDDIEIETLPAAEIVRPTDETMIHIDRVAKTGLGSEGDLGIAKS